MNSALRSRIMVGEKPYGNQNGSAWIPKQNGSTQFKFDEISQLRKGGGEKSG
jgi:hypothetical protein